MGYDGVKMKESIRRIEREFQDYEKVFLFELTVNITGWKNFQILVHQRKFS